MSDKVIKVLCQRVVALQQQQDELARNEIALIATLTELLPGFAQEFARLRIVVEKVASPRNAEELATLIKELKVEEDPLRRLWQAPSCPQEESHRL
jgi:phage shock protein A